jgi:hypothetical protein
MDVDKIAQVCKWPRRSTTKRLDVDTYL